MAIKHQDIDLNIESYIKLSSVTINEAGTFIEEVTDEEGNITKNDTGIKKYNIVLNLDFYTNSNKDYIYKKKQVSIDGVKEEDCNLVFFYTKLLEIFKDSISV